jgi:hypothetical protein
MKNQHLGTIQTQQGVANALLCRDADRPDEIMVHWWGANAKPQAVLARQTQRDDGALELAPQLIYQVDDGGGLMLAHLSDGDLAHARSVRAC